MIWFCSDCVQTTNSLVVQAQWVTPLLRTISQTTNQHLLTSSIPGYAQVKRADASAVNIYVDEELINAEYTAGDGSVQGWFTHHQQNNA